ncbi:MFS transporter [Kineococcus sp. GCM10028916]|uniref:MFS transporter n=1 Tax=Kineococcus sp. GCM10028916 TaxID=3273394 RepID=UPI00362A03E7
MIDLRPLRHRGFRNLWASSTATGTTAQLAGTALLFQVQTETGNTVLTGSVGAATAAATVAGNLVGGTLADRFDRRSVVLTATAVSAVAALGLAAASARGGVGAVFCLVVLQTVATSCGAPARRTFLRRLLPDQLVPAGVALLHLSFQIALLGGPVLGALLLASTGPAPAFLVDAIVSLTALFLLRRLPGVRASSARVSPFAGMSEVWRRPVLRTVLLCDLLATVLAMPVAVFPEIAAARFGDASRFGFLLAALAVGGVLTGLLSSRITGSARPVRFVVGGGVAWGLALAGFGFVDSPAPSLLLLVVAGAADTVSVIARGSLVQLHTPDEVLGRVSALEGVVGVAGPGVGNLRTGSLAQFTSPGFSLVVGGLSAAAAILWTTRRSWGGRVGRSWYN